MMERIKNALAEGPRAAASTIHYLYLARIPFLGWLTLFVLPLFARWVGRPLLLGGVRFGVRWRGFFRWNRLWISRWQHLFHRSRYYQSLLQAVSARHRSNSSKPNRQSVGGRDHRCFFRKHSGSCCRFKTDPFL